MNKGELIPYNPDYATAPGEVIGEYMEFYNMSREDFAGHLGLDLNAVEELLVGKRPVTQEMAAVMERLFHRPAQLWLNMEAGYQEDKRRLASHGGKRPGAGRKPNPRRRYSISLPGALGRELDALATRSGVTSYRWIVDTLTRALEEAR